MAVKVTAERKYKALIKHRTFGTAAVLLAVICVLSVFSGCAEVGAYDLNTKTVMTVGGYKVSYDEYRLWYMDRLNALGEETDEETLRAETEDIIKRKYALVSLCEEYGIKLTDTEKDEVDEYLEGFISDCGGEDGYKVYIENYYFTGRLFREQCELLYCTDSLIGEIKRGVDYAAVLSGAGESLYRYAVIYKARSEKIDEVYALLEAGEDFDAVASEYSDRIVNNQRGGYEYTYVGDEDKSVLITQAVAGLEIGKYSEVVCVPDDGYYILKRLEMETSVLEDDFDEIAEKFAKKSYIELREARAAGFKISYKKSYDKLTREKLKSGK